MGCTPGPSVVVNSHHELEVQVLAAVEDHGVHTQSPAKVFGGLGLPSAWEVEAENEGTTPQAAAFQVCSGGTGPCIWEQVKSRAVQA